MAYYWGRFFGEIMNGRIPTSAYKVCRKLDKWVEICVAPLVLLATYVFLKYPTHKLDLAFYDDGDTLYHVQSLMSGRIPYLEDAGHHFFGYLIPFVIAAKLVGFSVNLVHQVAAVHQVLTGFFVFLICRRFCGPLLSLLGGLLCLSAREPYVIGFFQQYQLNTLMVCGWWLLTFAQRRFWFLSLFILGIGFMFDQRALFFCIPPLLSQILSTGRSALPLKDLNAPLKSLLLNLSCGMGIFLLPAISALAWLTFNGGLHEFYRQTIVFPALYRSGGSLFESIKISLISLSFLWEKTPILLVTGLFGLVYPLAKGFTLHRLWILPPFFMILLSGRVYDYYSIPFLPVLSVLAMVALQQLLSDRYQTDAPSSPKRLLNLTVFRLIPLCAIASPVAHSIYTAGQMTPIESSNDGTQTLVKFLKTEMKPQDSLYVWSYRLDLYARLGKLSTSRYANPLMVQPDSQALGRKENVFPEAVSHFKQEFTKTPPTFLVLFKRNGKQLLSPLDPMINSALKNDYDQVLNLTSIDFTDTDCEYFVYRRKGG